jgi:predicted kinase
MCGQIIIDPLDCELDHIIELTPENVQDVMISLNPDNVQILCHKCHDKKHHRFGYQPRKEVCIVYGPPLAGKKTFVRQNLKRGNLVVDMDLLYAAVSMLPSYDKPDNLLINVLGVHNQLIDNVKTRLGKWGNAWVIGGYADKYKREKLADDLGAELVFCNTSKEMCLARLAMDTERQFRQDEWTKYINKWFEEYRE